MEVNMNSNWITPSKVLDRTALYRFSKKITLDAGARLSLSVSADTRYRLYFNGEYICEGPCKSDHFSYRYESVTVPAELVKQGENLIMVDVLFLAEPIMQTQLRGDRCALIVFGTAGENSIVTDESWECEIINGARFVGDKSAGLSPDVPPFERRGLCENESVGSSLLQYCRLEEGGASPYGLLDDRYLTPRTIKLFKPQAPKAFKEYNRTDTSLTLDAGAYTTAYPEFKFKGERGGKIRFTYSECTLDENGKKGRRDDPYGAITGVYDEVELSGEEQSFEPYFERAFRYIKVDMPEKTVFDTEKQYYKPYFYPVRDKGGVTFADEKLNKISEISVNTMQCCVHETFVDCPYYEQCQYDMDTAIEMMVMMRMTDDYSMPKKAVYDLSRSIRPDGMLCAHYPTSRVQIIPNFSLYWILMLRDYVTCSGDMAAAKELLPTADKILNAFDALLDENGLVKQVLGYWHYTDWVPGWERGTPPAGKGAPLTTSSMLYAYALGAAASLAADIGRNGLCVEYNERKTVLTSSINKHCYDEEKGFYVDAFGVGGYSEHTAVLAVLSDCVSGDAARELLDRSFAMDVNRASFSFNYYTFRAIEKAGCYSKYFDRLFGGWYKMLDMGCTTWCENPDDPRSECHAWSSAPIYEYSAVIAGVRPVSNGYADVEIRPDTELCKRFKKLEGNIPTPLGYISVKIEVTEQKRELTVKLPSHMKAKAVFFGEEASSCGADISISL